MSGRKKWAFAAIVAAMVAAPVGAQTGGVNSGGQPSGVGLGGGSGALTSSGLAGTLNTPNSGTGQGSIQQPQVYANNGYSKPTGTSQTSLSKDNFLSGYTGNPSYQGIGTSYNPTPGGLGIPLYASSSGTTTSSSTTGTRGSSSSSRVGGSMSNFNTQNQSGIVVPLPVQINYAAQMQFSSPRVAANRVQTELRTSIDNSSRITSGKTVEVLIDVNNNVTLRGKVKDEDEARVIEGVVRLTPGVGEIKNELLFPLP